MRKDYGVCIEAILVLLAYSYSVNNYVSATFVVIGLAIVVGAWMVEWSVERFLILLGIYSLQSVLYFSSDLAFNFVGELGLVACNSMFCMVLMSNAESTYWFKSSLMIYGIFVVLCLLLPSSLTCYLINGDPGFSHMIQFGSFVFVPTILMSGLKVVLYPLRGYRLVLLK